MESLEFGGLIGGGGPSRVPQIRWTEPLGGWGLLGALSIAAESPTTVVWAPNVGVVANEDNPNLTGVANPLKTSAPDMVARLVHSAALGPRRFRGRLASVGPDQHRGHQPDLYGLGRRFQRRL